MKTKERGMLGCLWLSRPIISSYSEKIDRQHETNKKKKKKKSNSSYGQRRKNKTRCAVRKAAEKERRCKRTFQEQGN